MPIQFSKKNKPKFINLIPQDKFESTDFGRILKWALSSFRVMVIVTELVVMSAFMSRFWLDARNSDLNDEINNSKSQILAYKKVETEFRSIQEKLAIVKKLYSGTKLSSLIEDIAKLVPEDVVLVSISNINGDLTIKSASFSEKSVAQFIANLENDKKLTSVNLSQVSSNFDDNIVNIFTITAKVNNIGGGNQ